MINFIMNLQNSLLGRIYLSLTKFADKYLFSALLFFIRFWIARIFLYSGLTKINDWQSTLYLFEHEYSVPFLPVIFAAVSATAIELSAPIFLFIGLLTRLAALPLLFMTAVIQFTYLDFIDHLYWAILLFTLIFHGAGRYSLDHLIFHKIQIR
jgi:putative oxidoreductase